ncbi:MAG: MFS transporter [Halieaceae bacterium]|nr:MFS transporter [Halieaceae bacterium]
MSIATRNLSLLIGAQLAFVSGSVITVTMGGIIGAKIAPSASIATLPVSLMILGTALGTIPASRIMQTFGRKTGFIGAAIAAAGAMVLAGIAIEKSLFWLYCIATACTGVTIAFSQQFRFAAAESVSLHRAGLAISLILIGSIGGAFLGPELISQGERFADNAFIGALQAAAGFFCIAAILLACLSLPETIAATDQDPAQAPRPLLEIAQNPYFILAVLSGTVGYGVMTYIMTATPVSMHVHDGHSLTDTAEVIRAHVLGMYVPSLFSGLLITRFGEKPIITLGLIAYAVTLAAAFAGQQVMHYAVSMILLGVGWNFMFVGGTTLLVSTYRASERFRVQGVNDAAVFGTSAVGSLLAGTLLSSFGWTTVIASTIPALAVVTVTLIWLRGKPLPTV